MATRLKLAIFDCDGTLVDSQHAIVACMAEAWEEHKLGHCDPERVRRIVGLSLVEAVARLLPDESPERHHALAESYRQAFAARRRAATLEEPLYPGVIEALAALEEAGVLLGVATGKSRRGLDQVLARHGLEGRFVTLQTPDHCPGKPHPAMVLRALEESGVARDQAVMIGDTTFDIEMAVNARIAGLGVGWGYHPVAELTAAGARKIVTEAGELANAVLALLRSGEGKNEG